MNEAIETKEYKGLFIKTYVDELADSPREWDNLGVCAFFHKRYDFGDKVDIDSDDFDSLNEIAAHIRNELNGVIIIPVYMYEHSGIGLSVSRSQYPFNCPWDSGTLGFIYATREAILKCFEVKYITKKIKKKVESNLIGEIETLSDYVSGQVYGYTVEDSQGEHIDSCWSYFGYDDMMNAAKEAIDYHRKHPQLGLFQTPEMIEV